MAKNTDPKLSRYFQIANRLRSGKEVASEDTKFFLEYSPEIDQAKMQKLVDGGEFVSFEDAQGALMEATRALQSSPQYKQQVLEIAQEAEASRNSEKLATGINLVLGGIDTANSIAQIRSANQAIKKSKKPGRPAVPQRDLYLQQALRSSEEGMMDAGRALAPAQAQIQDQYLSDINDAKTSSTGQAGAYGAYRQLAANRRNRAAMDLAPIQDQIRRGQQERYDSLLGMRQNETQQMFDNQAQLYNQDLQQYGLDQSAAAHLGATGRENLRGSLYNMGSQTANYIGQQQAQNKYRNLYNQAEVAGLNPDNITKVRQNLDNYNRIQDIGPSYWNQMY